MNDVEFIKLRDEFCRLLEPETLKADKDCWNFYINSTPENLKIYETSQDEMCKLYQDKNFYEKFLKFKETELKDKHLIVQLKRILREFEEELNAGEIKKALRDKENEIAAKFNSYVPMIDGKEVSKTELGIILQTSKDCELRKKAYSARIKGGDIIAADMAEFVKLRNEFARTKGYKNFFEYSLKEIYEVDIEHLKELLDTVYKKAKKAVSKYTEENKRELSIIFDVEPDKLKAYHLGLLPENNPVRKINEYLKTKEQIVDIAKNTYMKMGFDIDKMPIIMDLFPRKNKNTHGFCFDIEAGKDARILANLTNDSSSINTLCHELGHCVYHLGVDTTLPYLDREEYPALTEAVAMLAGDLQQRENILKGIVPDDVIAKFRSEYKKNEVKFISRCMLIIGFEKAMYENPNRDLARLWHDLRCKYTGANKSDEINNEWAAVPHYLSHPGYYQNYFRADLMKAQIYDFLKRKFGLISENNNVAEYLNKNLFQFGTSHDEDELIERFTGERLTCNSFCRSLECEDAEKS